MTHKRNKNRNIIIEGGVEEYLTFNRNKQEENGPKVDYLPRYKELRAKTPGQQKYIDTVRASTITFVVGPPGSSKTFSAVGLAVEALRSGKVEKIVFSRPIVEACGEKLGTLPGSISERLEPYFVPLFDALHFFSAKEEVEKWVAKETIEIVPCAYLRGRTLRDSFIIVDECQNLTYEQIKLILTRLGENSYIIFTADPDQSDLKSYDRGGIERFISILKNMSGIGLCHLHKEDIVRSPFIARVLERCEQHEKKEKEEDVVPRGYTGY